ncbi:hypothetical protein C8J57DRAFT_1514153 [Mycena rebaudengoi]|nr:hypothetical protein C8J57DRAFT_1514153 [Mycena rebaudengoi]
MANMCALKHLELDMLPRSAFPSYSDYALILGTCTRLTHLQLRWAGCRDFDYLTGTEAYPALRSTSVTNLVLAFDVNPGLGLLVSLFRFVNLRHVFMDISHVKGLTSALLCAPIFTNSFFFQFRNPQHLTTLLHSLFDHPRRYGEVQDFDFAHTQHLLIESTTGQSLIQQSAYLNPVRPGNLQQLTTHHRTSTIPSRSLIFKLPSRREVITDFQKRQFFDWQPLEIQTAPWDIDEDPVLDKVWVVKCQY